MNPTQRCIAQVCGEGRDGTCLCVVTEKQHGLIGRCRPRGLVPILRQDRAHARQSLKLPCRFKVPAKSHHVTLTEFGKYPENCQNAHIKPEVSSHKLKMAANNAAPSGATDAVLKPSDPVPEGAMPVKGLDFNDFKDRDITVAELVENMAQMGFQASSIGQAAKIVDGMVCSWSCLPTS